MAFLGSPNSFLGIDAGTSSLKIVELVGRRRRIEVSTYAQANLVNPLIAPEKPEEAVREVATLISRMMDEAKVSSDTVVAALPSSVVFSTVLELPNIPENEMEQAVRFAAREVVPAELDEMVLGWSRVGRLPRMAGDNNGADAGEKEADTKETKTIAVNGSASQPVFITAAPLAVVDRYTAVMKALKLNLLSLEVETFPLVRSLVTTPETPVLIVDFGDLATTFHIIDAGIPRATHTIERGGMQITQAIARALSVTEEKAETAKAEYGLQDNAPKAQRQATTQAVETQIQKAQQLMNHYRDTSGRAIKRAIFIGGGANMKGLPKYWSNATGQQASVGDPWRGLSYPQKLGAKLQELGPTYAVAVGLAMRGFSQEK